MHQKNVLIQIALGGIIEGCAIGWEKFMQQVPPIRVKELPKVFRDKLIKQWNGKTTQTVNERP